jgi:beta-glucosidase
MDGWELPSTPVLELQEFKRVPLRAGEKKTIHFELTPYQLSLLDANMVRRVEPGAFRFQVGGVSPDLPGDVTDDRKAKIEFNSSNEGVSAEFTEPKEYKANFKCKLETSKRMITGHLLLAIVTVKNEGNLTDVTKRSSMPEPSWSVGVLSCAQEKQNRTSFR